MRRRAGRLTAIAALALVAAACVTPTGGGGGGGGNPAPVASFTATPSSGPAPLTVNFDASASTDAGGIVAYAWNFGDGALELGVTTTHTFGAGTFTVTLIVTDNLGSTDIQTHTVTSTNAAPVAAFTSSATSGTAPLGISFDAAGSSDSDGTVVAYAWNFGDGGTAVGLNTAHTFADGVWTVTLTVTDNHGTTDTATLSINASNPAPVAAINANPLTGPGPLTVNFDGTTSHDPNGPIASYLWNFGDGGTSTLASPTHVFPVGTHTVTLTVTDEDGSIDTATTTITATNQSPVASFTRSPATGNAPLAVAFNGGGSSDPDGSITGYSWDFGDGGTATGVNPNHTFNVGTWTITLTVTDNNGATAATTNTVTVGNTPPVASFTTTPSSGNAPLLVGFNGAASSDANGIVVSYGWNFGDGGTGTGVNPNHTFGVGTFTVTLTVTDNHGGTGTTTRTVTSNNVAPVASFTTTPSSGPANLNVAFNASGSTDTSGTITSYSWDFDTAGAFAGDLASGVTTSHVYTAGAYTARLTVTDSFGASSSTTRTIAVSGTPSAAPTGLQKTGSGCCDTYGDFSWNLVPGADGYYIQIDGYFLGGCVTDHGATINGQVSSGRVQAVGLCLGSNYDARIQARANGNWGPYSGNINFNL